MVLIETGTESLRNEICFPGFFDGKTLQVIHEQKNQDRFFAAVDVRNRERRRENMRPKLYRFVKNKAQNKFLNYFCNTGTLSGAARAAGVTRQTHYYWMHDPEYAMAFEEARTMMCSLLEDEAYRRGVEGIDTPVFYKGEMVGTIKKYSDTMLTLLMKGNMPDKYKDRVETENVGESSASISWEGDDDDGTEKDRDTVPAGETLEDNDSSKP